MCSVGFKCIGCSDRRRENGRMRRFFFQAEDGIRDLVRSRGLGDVYKRQGVYLAKFNYNVSLLWLKSIAENENTVNSDTPLLLSLIHI